MGMSMSDGRWLVDEIELKMGDLNRIPAVERGVCLSDSPHGATDARSGDNTRDPRH